MVCCCLVLFCDEVCLRVWGLLCVLCLMYCVVSSDVFCLFVSVCACACSKYVLDYAR